MKVESLPEPSLLAAFFCAPLVTPLLAIPLIALLPGMYNSEVDLLIALPFVVVFSLVYGYLGMIFICLPVMLLLRFLKKFNAVTLCLCTTAIGASVWVLLFGDNMPSSEPVSRLVAFAIGAGCSLGVSVFFCVLGDIRLFNRAPLRDAE